MFIFVCINMFLFLNFNIANATDYNRDYQERDHYFNRENEKSDYNSKGISYFSLAGGKTEAEITMDNSSASWEFSNFELRTGYEANDFLGFESRIGFTSGFSETSNYYNYYWGQWDQIKFEYDLAYVSALTKLTASNYIIQPYCLLGFTLGYEEANLSTSYGHATEKAQWVEPSYGVGVEMDLGLSNLKGFAEYIVLGEVEETINDIEIETKLSSTNLGIIYSFQPPTDSKKVYSPEKEYETVEEREYKEKEEKNILQELPSFFEPRDIGLLHWQVEDQMEFNMDMIINKIDENSEHEATVYDRNDRVERYLLENRIGQSTLTNWFKKLKKDFIVIGKINKKDSGYEATVIIIDANQRKEFQIESNNMENIVNKISKIIINWEPKAGNQNI